MNLIKFENKSLTLAENQIYEAMKSRKLSEISFKERFKILQGEYIKCLAKLGYKPKDEAETMFEVQLLIEECENFQWLKEDDIKVIFKRALLGEFDGDEKVFYSIATFNKWVKKYYNELQKVEMKLIEESRKSETKEMPTEDQLKQQSILTINNYCDQVRKAKSNGKDYIFPFGGLHILYDYAKQFGFIKLTKEQKAEYIAKASTNNKLPMDAISQIAKGQAYKDFILTMVDFDLMIDSNGNIVDYGN